MYYKTKKSDSFRYFDIFLMRNIGGDDDMIFHLSHESNTHGREVTLLHLKPLKITGIIVKIERINRLKKITLAVNCQHKSVIEIQIWFGITLLYGWK